MCWMIPQVQEGVILEKIHMLTIITKDLCKTVLCVLILCDQIHPLNFGDVDLLQHLHPIYLQCPRLMIGFNMLNSFIRLKDIIISISVKYLLQDILIMFSLEW